MKRATVRQILQEIYHDHFAFLGWQTFADGAHYKEVTASIQGNPSVVASYNFDDFDGLHYKWLRWYITGHLSGLVQSGYVECVWLRFIYEGALGWFPATAQLCPSHSLSSVTFAFEGSSLPSDYQGLWGQDYSRKDLADEMFSIYMSEDDMTIIPTNGNASSLAILNGGKILPISPERGDVWAALAYAELGEEDLTACPDPLLHDATICPNPDVHNMPICVDPDRHDDVLYPVCPNPSDHGKICRDPDRHDDVLYPVCPDPSNHDNRGDVNQPVMMACGRHPNYICHTAKYHERWMKRRK